MTARVSWKQVAEDLANRLETHAFCEQHPLAEAKDDCPWCQDRAAYRRYLAAGGRNCAPPVHAAGRTVTLAEIVRGSSS